MKKWKLMLVLGVALAIIVVIAVILPAYAPAASSRTIHCQGTVRP